MTESAWQLSNSKFFLYSLSRPVKSPSCPQYAYRNSWKIAPSLQPRITTIEMRLAWWRRFPSYATGRFYGPMRKLRNSLISSTVGIFVWNMLCAFLFTRPSLRSDVFFFVLRTAVAFSKRLSGKPLGGGDIVVDGTPYYEIPGSRLFVPLVPLLYLWSIICARSLERSCTHYLIRVSFAIAARHCCRLLHWS